LKGILDDSYWMEKEYLKKKEETENNYLILTTYMNKESDLEIVNEESMIKQILGEKLPNKTIQRISKKEKQIEPETKITSSNNISKQVIEPEKIISGNYSSKPLKQKKNANCAELKFPYPNIITTSNQSNTRNMAKIRFIVMYVIRILLSRLLIPVIVTESRIERKLAR